MYQQLWLHQKKSICYYACRWHSFSLVGSLLLFLINMHLWMKWLHSYFVHVTFSLVYLEMLHFCLVLFFPHTLVNSHANPCMYIIRHHSKIWICRIIFGILLSRILCGTSVSLILWNLGFRLWLGLEYMWSIIKHFWTCLG